MPVLSARTRGDLLILLAALIWGVAFYFQKVAMQDIGPLLFLGMRGAIAALVLLPFVWREQRTDLRQMRPGNARIWPYGVLAGVVFFLAGGTQQTGIVIATVTNTGFLTALYVVVTPFLYWIVQRQRPALATWFSAGLAFVGVWALGGGSLESLNRGDILVACSSVFWAVLIIVSGKASRRAQPLTYTCIQFAVVALLSIISALLFERVEMAALRAALVPILYVGVLSSAFTFGIMAIALQVVPPPRASILLSMETVFAAMAGFLLLGERLSVAGWAGALLILMAVVVVQRTRE
ncbi:DMT family transporter [Granulosicoccus sp. 3-233]|uniref:DMT family transporter n=1 Tax=Granulosicoccus sp. 3-233 TaxID=3417969 RepID=UPI003D343B83